MKIRLFEKYDNGWYFIYFISKYLQFKWFTDCGWWFLYVHLGKRYWRFSDAGYLSGKTQ